MNVHRQGKVEYVIPVWWGFVLLDLVKCTISMNNERQMLVDQPRSSDHKVSGCATPLMVGCLPTSHALFTGMSLCYSRKKCWAVVEEFMALYMCLECESARNCLRAGN